MVNLLFRLLSKPHYTISTAESAIKKRGNTGLTLSLIHICAAMLLISAALLAYMTVLGINIGYVL